MHFQNSRLVHSLAPSLHHYLYLMSLSKHISSFQPKDLLSEGLLGSLASFLSVLLS